jgi:hypothetical protein
MTDPMTPRLTRLGDQLERAARRDLRGPARPRRRRRRIVLAAVAALVVVPGAAVAGYELISEGDVAQSMPAGTLALAGTQPDCSVVRENVEFHCVLARPPAPEVADWKGTVEPTVDATKHVNGGCRSLNSAGTEWRCYVGEEAVRQEIIGPGFLGELAPAPGVG